MPSPLLLSVCLQCLAFEVIMFLYLVSMGGGGGGGGGGDE